MKKALAIVLILSLAVGLCFCVAACETKQLKIVFLGDSIAEAVIGPSPLSERDNYGYYALIGKRNEYVYVNRSVSGHKTGDMLEYISRPDEDALMTASHLKTADIIQISILGNDLLQSDLSGLLVEFVKERHGEIAAEDTSREEILATSRVNFAAIIAKLKEINPTAKIFMQTVYNPVYAGSPIVGKSAKSILTSEPYNCTEDDLREYGAKLLATLNDVVFSYHEEHPDDFYIIDVNKAYSEIYDADKERGKNLIFPDGVHPSNEGHAVIADLTQKTLEELGLAKKTKALRNNKKIRIEQIKRLYPELEYYKIKNKINDAKTNEEVTEIYFSAIKGHTPELN